MTDKTTSKASAKTTAPQRTAKRSAPQRSGSALTTNAVSLQSALVDPLSASPEQIVALQRTYGNRAVQRMIGDAVQRKVTVGMEGGDVTPDVQSKINRASSGGQPLDRRVGSQIGGALGADFNGVRVHTDSKSDALNRSLSAKAFTLGSDVFFSKGAYNPGTHSGQHLLAHELTHVVQQGGGKSNEVQTKLTVGPAGDKYEEEADQVASRVMRMTEPAAQATLAMANRQADEISAGAVAPGSRLQLARGKAGRVAGSWLGPILGGLLLPFTLAAKGAKAGGNKALGKDAQGNQRSFGQASFGRKLGAIGLGALGGLGGLLGGAIGGALFTALNSLTLGAGGAFAANMAATQTFGDQNDRQGGVGGPALVNCNFVPFAINPPAVNEVGTWRIRGRRYTPLPAHAHGPGQNKVIVLFSGSGGTNEDQLGPLADYYTGQGSVVYAANYQGYGTSVHDTNAVGNDDTMLSESGLYEDAYRIYTYAQINSGVTPDNIILHGFSLGGSVAAHVAKRLAKRGQRLGGLVLHSSIDSAYTQADKGSAEMMGPVGHVIGPIAGMGNKMAAGSFDTASALKELAVYDPDLPVHLMSGSANAGDQLALGKTGLGDVATSNFNTVTQNEGAGGHLNTAQHAPTVGSQHQTDMGNLLGGGARAQGAPAGILKKLKALFS